MDKIVIEKIFDNILYHHNSVETIKCGRTYLDKKDKAVIEHFYEHEYEFRYGKGEYEKHAKEQLKHKY